MSERPIFELLEAARDRIMPIESWTTGTWARNADGCPCWPTSAAAVCWCARGSVYAEHGYASAGGLALLDQAARELYDLSSPEVNDALGHAAVLRIYDRAIRLARVRWERLAA
jgi:hypothetical protein